MEERRSMEERAAWYRLGLRGKDGFRIEIHRTALKEIGHRLLPTSSLVLEHREHFPGLPEFASFEQPRCGFGGVLSRTCDSASPWVVYSGTFPGVRDDRWLHHATLNAVFDALLSFKGKTDEQAPQFVLVKRLCPFDAYGQVYPPFEAVLLPSICRWIVSDHTGVWLSAENAMYRAVNHMRGVTDRTLYEAGRDASGRIILAIAGGATCGTLEPWPTDSRRGCALVSYSVVTHEQLAFFAALCRLDERARPTGTEPQQPVPAV